MSDVMSTYRYVALEDILNYAENPRHEVGFNQYDILKKLLSKVGSQYMYNLAKDIYLNGLLPSNLTTLVFDDDQRKYIVYEGNRRIACLKMLKNPEILKNIDRSLVSRVQKLKENTPNVNLDEVFCYITNEEEAYFIMERTHSGEDQGRGVKSWTPREKDNFRKRQKQRVSVELIISERFETFYNIDITKKFLSHQFNGYLIIGKSKKCLS